MNDAPKISHPLGLDGPWECVPTDQRSVEVRLLDAVMLHMEADEKFKTSPRGGGPLAESDGRRTARKNAFEAQEQMKVRMLEYRECRLLGRWVVNVVGKTP